jgi:hypothetical protein
MQLAIARNCSKSSDKPPRLSYQSSKSGYASPFMTNQYRTSPELPCSPATTAWLSCFLRLLLMACVLAYVPSSTARESMRYIHAAPEIPGDIRATYFWELLAAALETNRDKYGDYEVITYPTPMSHLRTLAELEAGDQGRVNVFVPATNPDLESNLTPVRLPVEKGLLGYRMFLIMPETQEKLDKVRNADDLRRFTIGQSKPWTDTKILEANHFQVSIGNDYTSLFMMLGSRRFDIFSRGIDEIAQEWRLQKNKVPGLTIEHSLILHYPMPRYYFFPKTEQGEKLARRLEDGLRRLASSGEFERRYQAYKQRMLADVDLSGRRVLEIPNPLLSSPIPLSDKTWWDDLSRELGRKK